MQDSMMEGETPTREQITELLKDNLLAGVEFGEGTTDTVKIETRMTESEQWQPYTAGDKAVFAPDEALTILVDLYEAGYALRAEMTASLSGDWDAEIEVGQQKDLHES